MKTAELTGAALNWAVAMCESTETISGTPTAWWHGYNPAEDWTQGGPIIEREMIELVPQSPALWDAMKRNQHIPSDGPTPLVAAMRCYVASKLGDDVEIPEGL
jgi:hypothetical protein